MHYDLTNLMLATVGTIFRSGTIEHSILRRATSTRRINRSFEVLGNGDIMKMKSRGLGNPMMGLSCGDTFELSASKQDVVKIARYMRDCDRYCNFSIAILCRGTKLQGWCDKSRQTIRASGGKGK